MDVQSGRERTSVHGGMNMDCRDCEHYVKAHYKGTPEDELYDECEFHWEVLHSLKTCKDFKEKDTKRNKRWKLSLRK